ncbi:MAG: YDG domain-containing protein, partial [Oscillospiraceae bacterium]
ATTTANITPKALTWNTDGKVASKTYDTTNSADVATAPKLVGVLSGDTVTVINGSVTFASANVGTHAITAADFGIEGTHAANYTAPTIQPVFANGTIHVKNVENPTVEVLDTYAFTGSQIKPDFAVKDGEKYIAANDYTVTYGENVNAGTDAGSVTVTLKGNYSGSATKKFTIEKATSTSVVAPEPILMTADTVKPYSIPLPTGAGNAGTLTYRVDALTGDNIFKIDGAPKINNTNKTLEFTSAAGTAKDQTAAVVITIGSDNYKDFTVTLKFEITTKRSVELTGLTAAQNLVYNGSAQQGYTGTLLIDGHNITDEQRKTLIFAYKGINGTTYDKTTAPTDAGSYKLVVSVDGTNADYT